MFHKTLSATAIAVTLAGAALAQDQSIIVQSTTSTANSGLYDYLLPLFQKESGIQVNVVAVGTGQAIANARNCDGDLLLVHAKPDEEAFVADGFGTERTDLMYNDFVIVGPAGDPAGIKGMQDVQGALTKIADGKAMFASRGDDSGTYKKEMQLWEEASVDPKAASGTWYRETGSGMGATLNAGIGMGAYVLTDRATWISFENKQDYAIDVEGDTDMFNQYGVIPINPEKCPSVKVEAAQTFADWLLSDAGQTAIADYKIDGQQLFFPNAPKE
ncbi:tungstate transport system substrate-binding protein [Loktanella atrilutea]|uniref:Tungstate transport system substrate-binding protein n=1 Tax=Loktanella atrilutea TaxID=366533 RepID=A0A1M4T2R6_LOKAT|nr:substrate-binding domain-containing protein [Loktanella atrilutea]SHE38587.1 tungstate transport system substrate-binding protein [Loktanella atrilutea]